MAVAMLLRNGPAYRQESWIGYNFAGLERKGKQILTLQKKDAITTVSS